MRVFALFLMVGLACSQQRPPDFSNSQRVADRIRAGNLYLSLSDALSLAIENNLDIEVQRYGRRIADADLRRARGGGIVRGLNYSLLEAPAGVGGPLSPVLTNAASGARTGSGSSVSTNNVALGALSSPQSNLSILGTVAQATGTSVPNFDPALTGVLSRNRQSLPQTNLSSTGTPDLLTTTLTANGGVQQGFSSGAQVSIGYVNLRQSLNSVRSSYSPFTNSSLGVTVTQPLLRGFGASLNNRFIRIAANEQKIADLLFRSSS